MLIQTLTNKALFTIFYLETYILKDILFIYKVIDILLFKYIEGYNLHKISAKYVLSSFH